MPPVALPNLYVLPSDLYDEFSTEGVQLRLDDHMQATGQVVQATADAPAAAVSLPVTALTSPLLRGSVLEFEGGGMPAAVEVTLSATAPVGAVSLAVAPLSAAVNALAAAPDSGVNVALAARLLKACRYATDQVKLYCCARYNDSALAKSWSVNRWATALAMRRLTRRRGQSCPKSVEEGAKEALEELKAVRYGVLNIEGIGTRTAGHPFIVNATVDPSYTYAKVRVEPQLSEGTPTQFGSFVDWNAIAFLGGEF